MCFGRQIWLIVVLSYDGSLALVIIRHHAPLTHCQECLLYFVPARSFPLLSFLPTLISDRVAFGDCGSALSFLLSFFLCDHITWHSYYCICVCRDWCFHPSSRWLHWIHQYPLRVLCFLTFSSSSPSQSLMKWGCGTVFSSARLLCMIVSRLVEQTTTRETDM